MKCGKMPVMFYKHDIEIVFFAEEYLCHFIHGDIIPYTIAVKIT